MTTHETRSGNDDSDSYQVLTFELGNETYGVDILRVQEIRGWSRVTRLPNTPEQMLGVLNLRGSIVPIVDLRKHFNLEHAEYTAVTVIIVLSTRGKNGQLNVGIVVDGVSDVADIESAAVKPTPDIGSREATAAIRGFASVGERMTVLLDVDRLLGADGSGACGPAAAIAADDVQAA